MHGSNSTNYILQQKVDTLLESFNKIAVEDNLLELRREFEMRQHSLSGSLLIWEKVGVSGSWLLADFGNEKIYHINKGNEQEMIVLEAPWNPGNLESRFKDKSYGSHEGFIDWLKLFNLEESDLEGLKRTDLSGQKLSLEIAHNDLLAAYKLLQEILTSTRESLIGLSKDDVQQIREYLERWYEVVEEILAINRSTERKRHAEVLQEIFHFSDEVKQQLGQVATYLNSKKSEQLETQMSTTVAEVLEKLGSETDLLQKQREEAEKNESDRQNEFAELRKKLTDERAKKLTSEQQLTFDQQAKRHQQVAWAWLSAAVLLIVGLMIGIIRVGLLDILKLEGLEESEWMEVLQNIFKKGSVLTVFYFALNRSIKNYGAQKHLEIVNRHRQKALDTFPELLESSGDNPETRHAVLSAATNAIFDTNQSGYLSSKTKGSESTNPIQLLVREILPGSSRSTGAGE